MMLPPPDRTDVHLAARTEMRRQPVPIRPAAFVRRACRIARDADVPSYNLDRLVAQMAALAEEIYASDERP